MITLKWITVTIENGVFGIKKQRQHLNYNSFAKHLVLTNCGFKLMLPDIIIQDNIVEKYNDIRDNLFVINCCLLDHRSQKLKNIGSDHKTASLYCVECNFYIAIVCNWEQPRYIQHTWFITTTRNNCPITICKPVHSKHYVEMTASYMFSLNVQ